MRTRYARLFVVALLASATVVVPGSSSAQEILDPCRATAVLGIPTPYGHEVTGSATYSCTKNEPDGVTVVGCLLLDGVPVDCDGAVGSSSASVDLSFPCVPGVWTVVAVGAGAGRTAPAPDLEGPAVVIQCDPLRPSP